MYSVKIVFACLFAAVGFGCVFAGDAEASTDGDASAGDLKILRKLLPPDDPFWCPFVRPLADTVALSAEDRSVLAGGVELIRERGGNFNEEDRNDADMQMIHTYQVMLDKEHGAGVTTGDLSFMLAVASKYRLYDAVRLLLEKGADPNVPYGTVGGLPKALIWCECLLPLSVAGDVRMAEVLLDGGADIDGRNFNRKDDFLGEGVPLPLMCAVRGGDREMVRFLIQRGADVNARWSCGGKSVLAEAAGQGDRETVALLLARGARVEFRDYWGKTALDYALDIEDEEIRLLLEKAGAIKGGMLEKAEKELLANGLVRIRAKAGNISFANPHTEEEQMVHGYRIKQHDSRTAVMGGGELTEMLPAAVLYGLYDVAELLLQKGADPNVPFFGWDGGAAVLPLSLCRDVQMAELLVKHGADVKGASVPPGEFYLKSATVPPPWAGARMRGNDEVAGFLLHKGAIEFAVPKGSRR